LGRSGGRSKFTRIERSLALKGNVRVVAATAFLAGLYSSMMGVIWQPFVLSLGASMSTLGFLESLGGEGGLVRALIQLPGGWFSDRVGRKPVIILSGLMGMSAISLFVLAGLVRDWRLLVPGVILIGMSVVARPGEAALIADSVHPNERGTAFSRYIFCYVAAGMFGPALGGLMANRWGYLPVFLTRVALEGLRVLVAACFLRETLRRQLPLLRPTALVTGIGRIVRLPRKLWGLYIAMTMDAFAWGLGATILFGLLSKSYHFTALQLGVMSSVFSISCALSQLPIGKLIDRFGCKRFLLLSELIGLFVVGGWFLFTNFKAFVLLHGLRGLVFSTFLPAYLALLSGSVSEEERGEAVGQLSALRGLIGFPAPYIGGRLYDLGGFKVPILANFLGVVATLILILLLVREPTEKA